MSEQLSLIDFINQAQIEKLDQTIDQIKEEVIQNFDSNHNYIARKKSFRLVKELTLIKSKLKKIKSLQHQLKSENYFLKSEKNLCSHDENQIIDKNLLENYEKLRLENEFLKDEINLQKDKFNSKITELENLIQTNHQDHNLRIKNNFQVEEDFKKELKKWQNYLEVFSAKTLDLISDLKNKKARLKDNRSQLNIKDLLPSEQQEIIFALEREINQSINNYLLIFKKNQRDQHALVDGLTKIKQSIEDQKL